MSKYNNLSCLLVLPQYRRQGFGLMLIEFSEYLLPCVFQLRCELVVQYPTNGPLNQAIHA